MGKDEATVMQEIIEERSDAIDDIYKGLVEVNKMFRDLSEIVKDNQVRIRMFIIFVQVYVQCICWNICHMAFRTVLQIYLSSYSSSSSLNLSIMAVSLLLFQCCVPL